MLRWKIRPMPLPVTLNDGILLYQMGYEVEIGNGKVIAVKKKKHL